MRLLKVEFYGIYKCYLSKILNLTNLSMSSYQNSSYQLPQPGEFDQNSTNHQQHNQQLEVTDIDFPRIHHYILLI